MLQNPVTYLKNQLVAKGRSGGDGIYLFGASVTADPAAHSHSDTYEAAKDFIKAFLTTQEGSELVATLCLTGDQHMSAEAPCWHEFAGSELHIYREGGLLSFMAVINTVEIQDFDEHVEIWSHLSLTVAKIANCAAGHIRFLVINAFMSWDRMEEENLLYPTLHESN